MTAVADRPTIQLTKAWTPLRQHSQQAALWHSKARFAIVPAGRRSGKTMLAKRKAVMFLWDCYVSPRDWADPRAFVAAPTREQAKRIWWQDLKALTPSEWVASINETEMCIKTHWGAELWVIGLDKASRTEGVSWDFCIIDELADCKPDTWDAHIRPALSDRLGGAWLIGVPDRDAPGQIFYEKMVHEAKTDQSGEWECYSWPSGDILPAEEVESAKKRMDPRIFAQEYLGQFILAGGRAFEDFDAKVHVKQVDYDEHLHICWSLDFNIDPMCSLVIQHYKGDVRVIDEFRLPDTKTELACEVFLDTAKTKGWNLAGLQVYGDASGGARDSTSGVTDWYIVQNKLKNVPGFKQKVPRANPPIKDTINAVNAKLKSADGATALWVDKKCEGLASDLRSALWPSDMAEQHSLAALRYFLNWEYPVLPEKRSQILLGRIGFSGGNK